MVPTAEEFIDQEDYKAINGDEIVTPIRKIMIDFAKLSELTVFYLCHARGPLKLAHQNRGPLHSITGLSTK